MGNPGQYPSLDLESVMAPSQRVDQLADRDARAKLSASLNPYWQVVTKDCHLGYFKSETLRIWIARCVLVNNQFADQRIGEADDFAKADGVLVMNFEQASAAARNWYCEQMLKEAAKPIDDSPFGIGTACGRK